jgi:hypothetical protein
LAPFAITEAATEAAPIPGAHSTPDSFGLIGGKCVLQAFLLHRASGADLLGRHRKRFVFSRREEKVGVDPGAG